MTDAETTVAALRPDRAIVVSATERTAHLADADCSRRRQIKHGRELSAGVYFADAAVCRDCLADAAREGPGGAAALDLEGDR